MKIQLVQFLMKVSVKTFPNFPKNVAIKFFENSTQEYPYPYHYII